MNVWFPFSSGSTGNSGGGRTVEDDENQNTSNYPNCSNNNISTEHPSRVYEMPAWTATKENQTAATTHSPGPFIAGVLPVAHSFFPSNSVSNGLQPPPQYRSSPPSSIESDQSVPSSQRNYFTPSVDGYQQHPTPNSYRQTSGTSPSCHPPPNFHPPSQTPQAASLTTISSHQSPGSSSLPRIPDGGGESGGEQIWPWMTVVGEFRKMCSINVRKSINCTWSRIAHDPSNIFSVF